MVILKDCELISRIQGITQIEFHICLGGKSRLLFGVIESVLCETGCNFLVFKGGIILSTARCLISRKSLRRNEPPQMEFVFNVSLYPFLPPPPCMHTIHQRNIAPACYLAVDSVNISCRHCFLCGLGTENCSLTFSQVSDKYRQLWQLNVACRRNR